MYNSSIPDILDVSYKFNRMTFGHLWLLFTYNVFRVHSCSACTSQSYLWPNFFFFFPLSWRKRRTRRRERIWSRLHPQRGAHGGSRSHESWDRDLSRTQVWHLTTWATQAPLATFLIERMPHFLCLFVSWWTCGPLCLLAIANNAVVNIGIRVSVSCFGYRPRSGINC